MCYRLTADCLIANHFFYHREADTVSLSELQDEAYAIVAECNNGIVADVSYFDVADAVLGDTILFELGENSLSLKSSSQRVYLQRKAAIARNLLPRYVRDAMEKVFIGPDAPSL